MALAPCHAALELARIVDDLAKREVLHGKVLDDVRIEALDCILALARAHGRSGTGCS